MNAPRKPAVAVIGTGGTIASVGGDGLELVRYIDRKHQLDALNEAARTGVAVAHCSRVGSGRVPALGASHARGSVAADNLTPQKARILLMLGLTRARNRTELQRMFDTY